MERIGEDWGISKLRVETASFLRKNQDEFIHFMEEEYTSGDGFEKYCADLESTAAWGGQIEVRALSQVLSRPIKVIQADGPPLVFGEEFKKPGLTLTFHRHKFQLGAHYNSAIPKEET
ncbi:unnamed protein product [Orchesella dallaii]|uniref:OTU domain-containing protein n=1 Tax=Orchesella dallaii TaxID=48710 RepID=A0ABP1QGF8_9HEXA